MMLDWNSPKYIDLPDLRMAVFEAGTPRDDRPSVVLCHGWPEVAYSWRKVVPQLVQAGWHVLVPEQRGYGFTGKALNDAGDESGVPLYDMEHLTGDMAHLLDACGLEKAVFAGHDWGGIMIWQLPFFQAERIAGLIGESGANIIDVTHHRLFLDVPAKAADLDFTIETRDAEHTAAVEAALHAAGLMPRRLSSSGS